MEACGQEGRGCSADQKKKKKYRMRQKYRKILNACASAPALGNGGNDDQRRAELEKMKIKQGTRNNLHYYGRKKKGKDVLVHVMKA